MTLLTEVAARTVAPGPRCSVAGIAGRLSADEAADLASLLADDTVQLTSIARALKARGHRVAASTLGRHRRDECLCSVL